MPKHLRRSGCSRSVTKSSPFENHLGIVEQTMQPQSRQYEVDRMCYKIVIEQSENNYAVYVPDLPGCVATGYTEQDVITEIHQAIVLHIESLIEHGEFDPRK